MEWTPGDKEGSRYKKNSIKNIFLLIFSIYYER